ncbi:MutS-related protein [Salinicoccus sp. Marseille-QA3877]
MVKIQTLYLILIVTILMILISAGIKIHEIYKTRKDIKNLWDRKEAFEAKKDSFVHYHNYFVNILENEDTDNRNIVDDETWSDLDLGQLIDKSNFTFTTIGEELLYAALRNSTENKVIDEDLIEDIKHDASFREKLSYRLAMLGKYKNSDTSKFMYEYIPEKKYKPLYILFSFLPVIGVFLFVLNPLFALIMIIAGLGINVYISQKHKGSTGFDYTDIFYTLNIIVTAGKLKSEYNSKGLKRLSLLSPLFVNDDNAREMNIAIQLFVVMKSLFLIDYHIYHAIIKSLNKNHELYKAGWHYVARLDLNYSVAMWRETLPYYSLPDVAEHSYINVEDLYHPLVTEAVENDLDFNKDILLTGSNASGKSTFMKALGINVVLSNGLNTSTSTHFEYHTGKVISSMDITDSVIEGDSYFISEMKSLKRIIDEADDFEGNLYCIIDEVFKGTNTAERVAAAESLLRYLNGKENIFLIAATHDMELTELMDKELEFYHFRENLIDDEIYFDYKIREGVSSTTNAIELLRLYKFPKEVYAEAKRKTCKGSESYTQ